MCSGWGEAGRGLSGLDRLSWEEEPWKRESVSRRSPNCKLLGLGCFSEGFSSESSFSSRTCDLLTLHSFLFFRPILLSSPKTEARLSLGRDNRESWDEMQDGPSEEELDSPEEAVDRVDTTDMRRRLDEWI